MDKLILEGFRSIKETTEIEIKPITILTGRNNSGKSTIIKALLFLSDYFGQRGQGYFNYDGIFSTKHKLFDFDNTQNWHFEKDYFRIELINGEFRQDFKFIKSWDNQTTLAKFRLYSKDKLSIEYNYSSNYVLEINFDLRSAGSKYDISVLDSAMRDKKQKLETERNELNVLINKILDGDEGKLNIGNDLKDFQNKIRSIDQKLSILDKYISTGMVTIQANFDNHTFELDYLRETTLLGIVNHFVLSELQLMELNKNLFSDSRSFAIYEPEEIVGSWLTTALSKQSKELFKLRVCYLGPNRTIQSRLYLKHDNNQDINVVANEFARIHLYDNSDAKVFMKKWLPIFNIGSDILVKNIENTACSIQIMNETNQEFISLSDKGYGAGQLTTILLQMALLIDSAPMSKKKVDIQPRPLLIIEEPEANLHPSFQSKLADLFVEVYEKYGIQLIVETHSEYLIRKLQVLSVTEKLNPKTVSIYYCEVDSDKRTRLNPIKILPDGRLSANFGKGFFDEAGSHTIALMAEKRKAKES